MMLTVVSSAGMVGATPVTAGTANAKTTTVLSQQTEQNKTKADQDQQKAQDQKNQKDQKDRQDQKDQQNNKDKEQNKDRGHDGQGNAGGGKGYAGSNGNAIHTNITNTQTGNNNVFSVIINYIFG